MHPLQAGERQGQAQARLITSAKALSKRLKLPATVIDALTIQQRDPMMKQIQTTEATADLLDAVLAKLPVEATKKEKKNDPAL